MPLKIFNPELINRYVLGLGNAARPCKFSRAKIASQTFLELFGQDGRRLAIDFGSPAQSLIFHDTAWFGGLALAATTDETWCFQVRLAGAKGVEAPIARLVLRQGDVVDIEGDVAARLSSRAVGRPICWMTVLVGWNASVGWISRVDGQIRRLRARMSVGQRRGVDTAPLV